MNAVAATGGEPLGFSSAPQAPKILAATRSALEVGENLRAQRAETAKPARRSGTVSTQSAERGIGLLG